MGIVIGFESQGIYVVTLIIIKEILNVMRGWEIYF